MSVNLNTSKSSNQNLQRKSAKQPRTLLKKIVLAVSVLILAIFALIISVIVYFYIGHRLDERKQLNAYSSAVEGCGKKPVVVIENIGYLLGGSVSYLAYTPNHSGYEDNKTIIDESPLGSTKVIFYSCSLD